MPRVTIDGWTLTGGGDDVARLDAARPEAKHRDGVEAHVHRAGDLEFVVTRGGVRMPNVIPRDVLRVLLLDARNQAALGLTVRET